MQKIFSTLSIVLICGCLITAQMPENRKNTTIVADVLAQMPASNIETFNQLMNDLASTGSEGVIAILKQFNAPAQGSNANAEYALSGLSAYVSAAGMETLRLPVVSGYLKALDEVTETETRAFIIRQLAIAGGDECVDKLAKYLSDEALCHYAAGALSGIGTENAGKALLEALKKANPNTVSFSEIVTAIERAEVKGAQLPYQLGYIRGFTNDYAHLLKQMYAQGDVKKARKEVKRLQKQITDTGGVHTRIAVLELQMMYDKSPEVILDALKDKSSEYRQAALRFASDFKGTKSELYRGMLTLLRKAKPDVQTEILNHIGNEAEKKPDMNDFYRDSIMFEDNKTQSLVYYNLINLSLGSSDYNVVQAASWAMVKAEVPQAASIFAGMISNPETELYIPLAKECLASVKGNIGGEIAAKVHRATDAGKIAIIELLAMRKASDYDTIVFALIDNNSPKVQQAVYKALKNVVADDDFDMLCDWLEIAHQEAIAHIQEAVVAAINSYPPKEQAAMIEQRMNRAGALAYLYYPVLASTGYKDALKTIIAGFNTGTGDAKDAAFDALLKWEGIETRNILYSICTNRAAAKYHNSAFDAYTRLASNPGMTGENRLIYLREAMNIAQTSQQKNKLLEEIGKTGTFLGLLYAGSFIDTPELTQAAANAVMNIALSNKNYSGSNIKALLNKVIEALDNPDADYQRQAIRKHLAEMLDGEGFVSIFNGKDLTGWKGLVENPIARTKMTAAQLSKAQLKADEQMHSDWKAADGLLVFDGAGYNNICTTKPYSNFEMYIDWKLDAHGTEPDAGIYLRGTPQVQIWDTSRVNVGAQVGSGGLYNNQIYTSKPLAVADNKTGDWNSFYIRMTGDRVTVMLNGVLVTDDVMLENFWDRSQPIPPIEQIELQAHGSKVYYRNIYIRELPRPEPYRLTAEEEKQGFVILFDGANMHQWTGNTVDYTIENGELVMNPSRSFGGNLYTKKEYADFTFRFEFQLTPAANNGLGIRTPMEGDAAYLGMELQILDNDHPIYKDLQQYQYHGSVYGVIAAKRGYLKPVGEWNTQEVTAKGNRITITLNGTVILDGDIAEASKNGTIDGNQHPGLRNKQGHIGFLGHGSPLKFRNIRVREL
ncbi:MAG: DUF1080 domain-containing protein [Cytophagaceae bacterium]|jgi:hypothetical protein|nr:DUF1080 domain-containing protein [Cytophagaceae bacterium]